MNYIFYVYLYPVVLESTDITDWKSEAFLIQLYEQYAIKLILKIDFFSTTVT